MLKLITDILDAWLELDFVTWDVIYCIMAVIFCFVSVSNYSFVSCAAAYLGPGCGRKVKRITSCILF